MGILLQFALMMLLPGKYVTFLHVQLSLLQKYPSKTCDVFSTKNTKTFHALFFLVNKRELQRPV
jgi:hypothetical protein